MARIGTEWRRAAQAGAGIRADWCRLVQIGADWSNWCRLVQVGAVYVYLAQISASCLHNPGKNSDVYASTSIPVICFILFHHIF